MKAKVTEEGLVIPKELLAGIEEVEIFTENHRIVIQPISQVDPILGLGSNPVMSGAPDASVHHDKYIYGSES